MLEQLVKELESNYSIYDHHHKNGHVYSYITISNRKIVSDIMSHGCLPRKSFTCEFPLALSTHLIPSFLRGYFDGDGCITIRKYNNKPYKYPNVNICCSYAFGTTAKNILNSLFDIRFSMHKSRSIYCISSCNKQAYMFMEMIYGDSLCPKLIRKFEKWQSIKEWYKPSR